MIGREGPGPERPGPDYPPEWDTEPDEYLVAGMTVGDFDRRYRFRMVEAYPVISGVPNVYEASHSEVDAGFARCLAARNLRRTHELYLADAEPDPDPVELIRQIVTPDPWQAQGPVPPPPF